MENKCKSKFNITGVFLFQKKYNYSKKGIKAIEEGDIKYLKSLLKRGKMIIIDAKDL